MTHSPSVWDAMIGAYHDSQVVRILGILFMAHVLCGTCIC
jgi:hypothetical protein